MSEPTNSDVQGYLLAIIERDRYQEVADKADTERKRYFNPAYKYLTDNGVVHTNTNNGPSYILYAEAGRIKIKEVKPLFGDLNE